MNHGLCGPQVISQMTQELTEMVYRCFLPILSISSMVQFSLCLQRAQHWVLDARAYNSLQEVRNVLICLTLICKDFPWYPPSHISTQWKLVLPNRYTNSLLNISWIFAKQGRTIATSTSPITLEKNDMQNVVAQTAAAFIWLGM